ncbi:MAG: ATP-binding protein [Thermodesulfovibrionia bacterium]
MLSHIENEGKVLIETLAIPILNDLIYERVGLVEEGGLIDNYILEIFKRKELDLLYISVLDEDGRVISHNDLKEYGKYYTDPLTIKAINSDTTIIQRFHDKGTGYDALDFAAPLSIGKKRWGTLRFGVSLEGVNKEISQIVRRIIILTILLLLVGFMIILLLTRQFIRPITEFAKTMETVSGEMLDVELEVKGYNEIAILKQSFNKMIKRIRNANMELIKANERLIHSEKLASIGTLAAGVAHQINNPLGGLFNCVEMLYKHGDREGFRNQYLALIEDGLMRIEGTVGKLLWMSRNDRGSGREIVNVKEVVRDVERFVEYELNKRGATFRDEIEDNLHLFINLADLQQMLLNLMINAAQAMRSGGELSVKGYKKDSKVFLEIKDTGEGIAEENINKIFDPFFTTKKVGEGTGLGLWLTYELVKNYNGNISVKSKKGEGTTFTLEFDET